MKIVLLVFAVLSAVLLSGCDSPIGGPSSGQNNMGPTYANKMEEKGWSSFIQPQHDDSSVP